MITLAQILPIAMPAMMTHHKKPYKLTDVLQRKNGSYFAYLIDPATTLHVLIAWGTHENTLPLEKDRIEFARKIIFSAMKTLDNLIATSPKTNVLVDHLIDKDVNK